MFTMLSTSIHERLANYTEYGGLLGDVLSQEIVLKDSDLSAGNSIATRCLWLSCKIKVFIHIATSIYSCTHTEAYALH